MYPSRSLLAVSSRSLRPPGGPLEVSSATSRSSRGLFGSLAVPSRSLRPPRGPLGPHLKNLNLVFFFRNWISHQHNIDNFINVLGLLLDTPTANYVNVHLNIVRILMNNKSLFLLKYRCNVNAVSGINH